MTRPGRVAIPQQHTPGQYHTAGAEVELTLHPLAAGSFTQRITIARRAARQTKWRYADMYLTRDQVGGLAGELAERAAAMTNHTTRGTPI